MVDLQPVTAEDETLERIAHQGGDLEGHGLVDVAKDMNHFDAERLHQLIENHARYTASARARAILDNWEDTLPKFVKVMPVEYRRVLLEMEQARATGTMAIGLAGGK
jgi:glutamate synthase (NADPH/NADH) large chain